MFLTNSSFTLSFQLEEFGSYISKTLIADFVADVMDCAMSKM